MWGFLKKALDSGQIITGVLAILVIVWFIKMPSETVGLITLDAWGKLQDPESYIYLFGWALFLVFFVLWLASLKKIAKLTSQERQQLETQL